MPPVASAAIFDTCNFTVTNVAFGNYDPTAAAATTAAGSITIDCILPTAVTLSISSGDAKRFTPRAMNETGGADTLGYYLYTPSGQNWGDGTGSTSTYGATFTLFSAAVPIAGSIPARENASAGSYTDALVVTATF
jgi:spore coat protein U-like protein